MKRGIWKGCISTTNERPNGFASILCVIMFFAFHACSQCDQIWRNSTTLAFPNFWQCVLRPFGFGAKFLTLFGTICILLGKIHYCKWPNIENTICSSGHTACSVLHDRSVLERVNRFRTTHLGSVRCLPVWPDWANFKKVIGDDFLHKWTEI